MIAFSFFLSITAFRAAGDLVKVAGSDVASDTASSGLRAFAAFLHPSGCAEEPLLGWSDFVPSNCPFWFAGHVVLSSQI
jgi:hypothetical protein